MDIPKTINVKGSLIDLSQPKIMGVINVTPDSFYGSSRKTELKDILMKAEKMLEEGATFLDIGGYSSRPHAIDISITDEISRIENPINELVKKFPSAIISIDTFRSEVARIAADAGASIINDISGGDLDDKMFATVAELELPYIIMHMRGTPQDMKQKTNYKDVLKEVTSSFLDKIKRLQKLGINDVIIDPGFGFAKTASQSFKILNGMNYLECIGKPILVGLSRKSMIYKSLKIDADHALNGTTVLNTVALMKGASILRVHDVQAAKEAVQLINLVRG